MALITGSIRGVTQLHTPAMLGRKAYLVTANFGANVGGTDTCTLTGVGAAIAGRTRNGRTVTVRTASPAGPGKDSNNLDVYMVGAAGTQNVTVAGDNLTGILGTAAAATQTSTACTGVQLIVCVDEA